MFLEATCTPWPKAFPLSSKSAKAVKPFSQYIHSYFISSHISLSRTLFWFPLPCSRTFLIISDPGDNTECVCVCVCVCTCVLSHVCLFVTPWAAVCQTLLFMEFSRQEYWSGLPFLSPGDLPDPGTEPSSLASPELAGRFFIIVPSGKPLYRIILF